MLKYLLLLLLSFTVSAAWVEKPLTLKVKGNTTYFNATIKTIKDGHNILSHTNSVCAQSLASHCRKGMLAYFRGVKNDDVIRRHSFDFKINSIGDSPQWVIVFQDWVRIYADDTNGNRPITTIKLRRFGDRLFLQHWNNAWQWEHDPSDYDTHLRDGRETMDGEYEVFTGSTYHIDFVIHDAGHAKLYIDGIKISDSKYKTTHLTEQHEVMIGMYWSKGFNLGNHEANRINIDYTNIKYAEVNL